MQKTIRDAKQAMRNQVCAAVARMEPGERVAASTQACALLEAQARWSAAQWVLLFAPLPEELNVWPLLTVALSAAKHVALPRFVAESKTYEACQVLDPRLDLKRGHFGIREPQSHCPPLPSSRPRSDPGPGVAFDLRGRRLGRGKGYYDQLLKDLRGTTCGVAFDQQIVEEVPVEPHDVRLDYVLTPTRWIETNRQE